MKIGIIAHLKHAIKTPFAGGLEAFTHQITNQLCGRGHEITLFASSSSATAGELYPIITDKNYDNNSGNRIRTPDLSSVYIAEHHAYFQLMTKIDNLGLDIIFNNSLHYVPITMANLLKTPMITVLHTPPFFELKNAIIAGKPTNSIKFVTVSKCNADNWGGYLDECETILNGIDTSKWVYYPSGKQKDYVVWFGRIHPDKGLDLAIKAARLAGIPLKVAGDIADKKYFNQKIEPLLDENTEMLGLLNHEELNELIGEAKVCLVTPVWQEPFGLVVAEALACGTPVAGTNVGALPEVLNDNCGALVSPGDIYGLAKAIETAMQFDRDQIRKHAEANLDIYHMVTKYEELFFSMIKDRHRCNNQILQQAC